MLQRLVGGIAKKMMRKIIVFILILKMLLYYLTGMSNITEAVIYVVYYAAVMNFALFCFNLLPIPPLDGSHILFSCLNLDPKTERLLIKIGIPLLLIILIIQNRTDITIIPIGTVVMAMVNLFL